MTGHEMNSLVESTDGGETWSPVSTDAGMQQNGGTALAYFVNTGSAATTRTTFLWIAQATGGFIGTWRTTNDGKSWTHVDKNEHGHGAASLYQPGNGVVWMPGVYSDLGWGVLRSTDAGATWTHFGDTGGHNAVIGTAAKMYAASGGPVGSGAMTDPEIELTALPGTGMWTDVSRPTGMDQGPAIFTTTFDGTHSILVTPNYNAGLWYYAEP